MSKFKNLYHLLAISPQATEQCIQTAMRNAAEKQTISLPDLKLCRKYLLDSQWRSRYDEKLRQECPDFFLSPAFSVVKPALISSNDGIIYRSDLPAHPLDPRYDLPKSEKNPAIRKLLIFSTLLIVISIFFGFSANLLSSKDRLSDLKNYLLTGYSKYGYGSSNYGNSGYKVFNQNATLEKYQRITSGMSKRQVIKIMGSSGQNVPVCTLKYRTRSAKAWYTPDRKGYIFVDFISNRVVSKTKHNLDDNEEV
ncbi:hypothetical protein PT286_07640 [Neisseriaceae bacterium ESL0693]|nr:hypothetical protein [Neisseriaceae bacterium ESL0693]